MKRKKSEGIEFGELRMNSGQAFRTAALARRADADSTSQYGKEAQRRQSGCAKSLLKQASAQSPDIPCQAGALQSGKELHAEHAACIGARIFIQALLRGTLRRQSLLPAEF